MIPLPKRMFVGLMPDRATQFAIQRHCRQWHWPEGCVPTRFGRYHLTLHFLGDIVGPGTEQRLRRALRDVAMRPLLLQLEGAQVWRNHVAVLRPREDSDLHALHHAVGTAMTAAGFAPSARFTPHVTLARHAQGACPPGSLAPIEWRAREFVLVWSRLYPEVKPARYEIVESFAAGGAAQDELPLFG